MDKNNKFDQKKYNADYIKSHYTDCKLRLKPDESEKIDYYLFRNKMSKNRFFINAAMYIIDNNIQLPTNTDKSANSED